MTNVSTRSTRVVAVAMYLWMLRQPSFTAAFSPPNKVTTTTAAAAATMEEAATATPSPPPPTTTSTTTKTNHDYDAPGLSIGGADMTAYRQGHVPKTKEYEPMMLSLSTQEDACSVLPSDFPTGTYYKIGPGGYESDDGMPYLHPFDANGKVLAVTLDASTTPQQAIYRYKHVQTPKYQQDKATGTMSERGFFGTPRAGGWLGNVFQGMSDPKNPANTAVILTDDQEQLFALWEAGRPFAMDPLTLDTKGEEFCGFLDAQTSFSAHPSYDPRKKTYTNFCITRPQPGKETTTVTFQEVDASSFQVCPNSKGIKLELPGIVTTHDITLSENYIVFPWNEAKVNVPDALKAMLGLLPPLALVESVPMDVARYILIPRDLLATGGTILDVFNDDRIQVVETPFHVAIHLTNAYEATSDNNNKNRLIFESTCMKGTGFNFGVKEMVQSGKPLWEVFDWDATPPHLEQFEIDLDTGNLLRMETIANESIEFTALPRSKLTQPHKILFSLGMHKPHFQQDDDSDTSKAAIYPHGSIRKIDLQTKEQDVFSFAPYECVQDGDVVRKVGASPDQEDAVYFITVVTNGRDLTSDLVILDGEDIEAGPITRIRLPEVVPNNGIHGNFYVGPNRFLLN